MRNKPTKPTTRSSPGMHIPLTFDKAVTGLLAVKPKQKGGQPQPKKKDSRKRNG